MNRPISLVPGSASISVFMRLTHDADNGAMTGIVAADVGSAHYVRTGGSDTSITLSDLASLTAAYSSGGMYEVADGWYRLDLPNASIAAGAREAVVHLAGNKSGTGFHGALAIDLGGVNVTAVDNAVLISHFGGTFPSDNRKWLGNTIVTPNLDGLPLVDCHYWKGVIISTPDTAGYPKVTVKSGTGAGEISLAAGLVILQDGSITTAKFAGNAITAAVLADGAIDRATFAADTGMQTLRSGTCQSGSTATTIKLDAGASSTNGFYVGCAAFPTGGTGALQPPNPIIGYDGTTKIATLAQSWFTTPDNTTTFAILKAVYGSNTIIMV